MDNKHNDRRIFDLAMHTWLRYALVFLKWLLWAAVIGTALGFISTAFHYSVDFAQELRLAYPWLLCLLPVGGLIIVFMYRACGVKDDRGANAVLEATINGEPVKKRVAPLIFTGTVLTHLFGGSAGREGAALQLGGSIAGLFSGVFHIKPGDGRVLTICGMSAAFSAHHRGCFRRGRSQRGRGSVRGAFPLRGQRLCGLPRVFRPGCAAHPL